MRRVRKPADLLADAKHLESRAQRAIKARTSPEWEDRAAWNAWIFNVGHLLQRAAQTRRWLLEEYEGIDKFASLGAADLAGGAMVARSLLSDLATLDEIDALARNLRGRASKALAEEGA